MKEHKMHYFSDCTGFPWMRSDADRSADLTSRVAHVTCGQCKGRILDVLRKQEWIFLPDDVKALLGQLAKQVKR